MIAAVPPPTQRDTGYYLSTFQLMCMLACFGPLCLYSPSSALEFHLVVDGIARIVSEMQASGSAYARIVGHGLSPAGPLREDAVTWRNVQMDILVTS